MYYYLNEINILLIFSYRFRKWELWHSILYTFCDHPRTRNIHVFKSPSFVICLIVLYIRHMLPCWCILYFLDKIHAVVSFFGSASADKRQHPHFVLHPTRGPCHSKHPECHLRLWFKCLADTETRQQKARRKM
jgi:hypothetical protein